MKDCRQFYIDGKWVAPTTPNDFPVTNPANEDHVAVISLGTAADVDKAVTAARQGVRDVRRDDAARSGWRSCNRIIAAYQARYEEMAETISTEMGAPLWLSRAAQVAAGIGHFFEMTKVLAELPVRGAEGLDAHAQGADRRVRPDHAVELAAEPDRLQGRAGARGRLHDGAEAERDRAALAATSSPQIMHEAGVPAGVFNLVNGDGPTVGAAHLVASRASTWCRSPARRAPASRSRTAAAPTVKRVTQELGGKSANIILDDADIAEAVAAGVQSCRDEHRPVVQRADAHARPEGQDGRGHRGREGRRRGGRRSAIRSPTARTSGRSPARRSTTRSRRLIKKGIEEGAQLVAGGPGRPDGLDQGLLRASRPSSRTSATT